ncbi:hypothetical protein [Roseateles sp.]|uniref:hypothetical protein n=1 Tax=Roseateles sp. TaxID=1971397 RepID=UPI002F404DE7
MAKRITTGSGATFDTIKAAKAHFSEIRESTKPGELLADPIRADVLDIYRRYCSATNYAAVLAIDVTTQLDKRQRAGGNYATTKAFAVVTAEGTPHIFSMDQALEAIAE